MEIIKAELARANERLAEAKDPRARAALEGVVMALKWVFEDGGQASPSERAAALVSEPSEPAEEAPAAPRKASPRRKKAR